MAEPALKQEPSSWTVGAFLDWDDGTDTRYELVKGEIMAMNPPAPLHSRLVGNLAHWIASRLTPPCGVNVEAGIMLLEKDDAYYQADLVVSCTLLTADHRYVPDPILIAEVLSASTEAHDRGTKVPDYRTLPSVQEILLLSSMAIEAELWQRVDTGWAVTELVGGEAGLILTTVDLDASLSALYEGIAF